MYIHRIKYACITYIFVCNDMNMRIGEYLRSLLIYMDVEHVWTNCDVMVLVCY